MPTTVLNAYSIAYPTITAAIRADVMKQSDPLAVVATETDIIPGHPARIWSFPGLERTNYIFTLNTIDGLGNPTGNLAFFDVVPSAISDVLVRNDEQITVGVTNGLIAGEREIFFDGGETSLGSGLFRPNYIGWNINPERLSPVGRTQIRGTEFALNSGEYSWNSVTGRYALLQDDGAGNFDVFLEGETFNIDFDPIQQTAGGSVSEFVDFAILLKTATYLVTPGDFGSKILCEPAGDYMELILPPIATVVGGRPLMIEVSKLNHCAVKISSSETKAYVGSFIACAGDSIRIYKFIRVAGITYEWRADMADGNFRTVGTMVATDFNNLSYPFSSPLNSVRLMGQDLSVYKYARLYEYVLGLPSAQVVPYVDWILGDNKYKWAYSDGDDFSPVFKAPDMRGIYIRSTNVDIPGSWFQQMIQYHRHIMAWGAEGSKTPPFPAPNRTSNFGFVGSGSTIDFDNLLWYTNDGSNNVLGNTIDPNAAGVIGLETRPNSRSTNINVLI